MSFFLVLGILGENMDKSDDKFLNELKNKFDYDSISGRLLLKGTCVDKSTTTSRGYRKIQFQSRGWLLHRLVFYYHNGYFPVVVDHVDGDVNNNKIENLNGCTQQENIEKARKFKTNKTGFKGVSYHKAANKYEGYFWKDYQKIYCGLWNTPEEAHEARQGRKYGRA
jgi:hypothetical protein